MMARCINRGENSQRHITLTAILHRDQQKLVLGSTYSLSSYQVHCIVLILSQMAMDSYLLCATFFSFGVLEALLVRMHELVSSKWLLQSSGGDFLYKF